MDSSPPATPTETIRASKYHHPPKAKSKAPANPVQAGILAFIGSNHPPLLQSDLTASHLPKRYTVYSPFLLLPSTFPLHSPQWSALYASLTPDQKHTLFATIAHSFRPPGTVTHMAISSPIPALNPIRRPDGLLPVYGDFGPDHLLAGDGKGEPTEEDFNAAFWVSAVQHTGIEQVWAPRWTMFSRGNVVEKGRILGISGPLEGLDDDESRELDVVDLYVGIGYFAFSYLSRPVRRVFGWDVNPWSVEGLRRGCIRNGWGVLIITVDGQGRVREPEMGVLVDCLTTGILVGGKELRLVAFHGDNRFAVQVMATIAEACHERSMEVGNVLQVRHVNLGLLPTARASWDTAVQILHPGGTGWLHVHENVHVRDIADKKAEIVREVDALVKQCWTQPGHVSCSHVAQVKSFAPDVVHCVYDIRIQPLPFG